MALQFFAPHWGNTLPFETFCANVREVGYDGIEMEAPIGTHQKAEFRRVLRENSLLFIGQYYQSFESNFTEHLRNYEYYLHNLIEENPVLINCQTGKDYFTFDQNCRLFACATRISAESGVKIIHETHRGKSLFSAHGTQQYLSHLPDLRICLDISHWCNVHESLLTDQSEALALAFSRTDHIHSRVGHPQGPQVNDPRAPEWSEALHTHLKWWDQVAEIHLQNATLLTITTEFGPAPYMPQSPYTQQPLANQWDINVFMMNLLKVRHGCL
ncbi:sugar phosphate isomerase/epimerase family protein [Arundinibacter roseus]|uniref:Sugar phosphate isomerase/epimerase n=1 Tax=Arundinibacter roseus TaxID=2070510 RepID=A0A4R4KHH3_9BACT|nr:sugar phosphate isomerase/epimerase [Arundinibacter roseus]TDB67547.1 sugar phosphate isomerase/epimerase [Arundinibacter roseus]